MKIAFLLILFLFVSNLFFSQTSAPTKQWEKTIRGQFNSPFETAVKSVSDDIGNIYVLTYAENINIVKYNSSGAIVDVFVYNGVNNIGEFAYDITLDSDGNIIVGARIYYNSRYCPAVIKISSTGALLWEQIFLATGSGYYNEVKSVAVGPNNEVYFAGVINDSSFVGKISAVGNVNWQSTITPNASYNYGQLNGIVVDDNGFAYVCGKAQKVGADFDYYVAKFSSIGVLVWQKMQNGLQSQDDEAMFIKVDNNYNCYVAGTILDSLSNNKTVVMAKYNSAGGQQWFKKLHQTTQELIELKGMKLDNLNNCILIMEEDRIGYNYTNARIIKLSNLGNINWNIIYEGNSLNQRPTSLTIDNFGNVIVAGEQQMASVPQMFYLKYNGSGTIIYEQVYDYTNQIAEKPVTLFHDNSGSFYVTLTLNNNFTSRSDVGLIKFSSSGVLQFESFYNNPSSSNSQATELILEGSKAMTFGTILNEFSAHDFAIASYDEQGNVIWQNVADFEGKHNYAADFEKNGSSIYVVGANGVSFDGALLVKYDSVGSPVWQDTMVGNFYSQVKVVSNGNPIIVGNSGYYSSEKDFRICTYNKNDGTRISFNSPSQVPDYSTQVYNAEVDANDNITVLGYYRYSDPIDYNLSFNRFQIQQFDASGNILWSKDLNGFDTTFIGYYGVNKLFLNSNNEIFVVLTGKLTGQSNFVTKIIKFSASGNEIWSQVYSTLGFDEMGQESAMSPNGEIYLISIIPNSIPLRVRKIDPNSGSIVWANDYSTYPLQGAGYPVIGFNSLGDFYLSYSSVLYPPHNGDDRIVLAKYDASGNEYWKTVFNGDYSGGDYAQELKVTNDGRIYLLMSAVMNPFGYSDITLFKFCDIPDPVISSSGPVNNLCPLSTVNLTASGGISYLWNDGVTTNSSLTVDTTGNYFSTVYLDDGCFKNTDTIAVTLKSVPTTPSICLVTVDSLSTHNIVIWDKTNVTGTSDFKIYREDVTNIYTHIATVPYDSLSEYHDFGANPNTTTKRYKISAIDSCGQESGLSNYHNTIYIVNSGLGQYTWNPLYTIENTGNPVNNYVLMRDDNTTGVWNQVSITAGTQNTLNDLNYALFPNASYRVETLWSIVCEPTRGPVNTTRSNIKTPTSIGINNIAQLTGLKLYPNPFSDYLTVESETSLDNSTIEILNNLGQVVFSKELSGRGAKLNIADLSSGVYYYTIKSAKFIKQGKVTKA